MKSSCASANRSARLMLISVFAARTSAKCSGVVPARLSSNRPTAEWITPWITGCRARSSARAGASASRRVASARRYRGRGPSAASRSSRAVIAASSGRRPSQTSCARCRRINCSLSTSPIPPAPPTIRYTPPSRNTGRRGAGHSQRASACRYQAPCRQAWLAPAWAPGQRRGAGSACGLLPGSMSATVTVHFGYSFARAPTRPCTPAWAGSMRSRGITGSAPDVIATKRSGRASQPSISSALIRRRQASTPRVWASRRRRASSAPASVAAASGATQITSAMAAEPRSCAASASTLAPWGSTRRRGAAEAAAMPSAAMSALAASQVSPARRGEAAGSGKARRRSQVGASSRAVSPRAESAVVAPASSTRALTPDSRAWMRPASSHRSMS
ncbi:hypothetical protein BUGL105410_37450 [Burkholderia gladioli]